MSPLKSNKAYAGIDRRALMERREGVDRRNLIRYETVGSDRRLQSYRRKEDDFWHNKRL